MKKLTYSYIVIALPFMVSCTSGKSPNAANFSDEDSVVVLDSMRPDGPPPPPPHGKGRPPHKVSRGLVEFKRRLNH
jgi:hypothetical protein